MQGYYVAAEDTSTDLDWQATMDYVANQRRYPVPTMTLKDCSNPLCTHQSYAIYCSNYCLAAVEPEVLEEPDDTDAYYRDTQSPTTLGLKTLADAQWQADQAAGGFAAMVCGVQPQAAPVAPSFTEAPVSCTVKGVHHGQDTMITIRGTDFASVQAQLEAACAWFDVPAAAQTPPVETGEGWCRIHSTHMRWNPGKGNEAGWWSHKPADGSDWCKGKVKGPVRHG